MQALAASAGVQPKKLSPIELMAMRIAASSPSFKFELRVDIASLPRADFTTLS